MKVKQKTRKSLTKRFKITKNGKVLRRKAFRGHLNVKLSGKKRRALRRIVSTDDAHAKKIKKVLGK